MIDFLSLIKDTGAYKTVLGDKRSGRLSHAYLVLCADGDNLDEYLKIFAKLIACDSEQPCGACRTCRLIDQKSHPDVFFYPEKGESVLAEDVNALIQESYIKPVEGDKKIFVLSNGQTMNASAQNKLLKTLEEPPKNVHIIIGATAEFNLLSTVKSRMKKLQIPFFTADRLFSSLKDECPDHDKLNSAIACGDGTVGKAKALYGDENLKDALECSADTLLNMTSSASVLEYSSKISALKCDLSDFLSVTELLLRDLLLGLDGKEDLVANKEFYKKVKNAKNFNKGSVLFALESITEANERKKFNANPTMLIEWLLFRILEGKYKWQKL